MITLLYLDEISKSLKNGDWYFFGMENDRKVYKCLEKRCNSQRFTSTGSLRRHKDHVHGKEFFCPMEKCFEKSNSRAELSKQRKRPKKNLGKGVF